VDIQNKKEYYSLDREGMFHSLNPTFIPKLILLSPVVTMYLNLFSIQKFYSAHNVPQCDFSGSENKQLFLI